MKVHLLEAFQNASRGLIETLVYCVQKAVAPLLEDISNDEIPPANKVEHFQSILNAQLLKIPLGHLGCLLNTNKDNMLETQGHLYSQKKHCLVMS